MSTTIIIAIADFFDGWWQRCRVELERITEIKNYTHGMLWKWNDAFDLCFFFYFGAKEVLGKAKHGKPSSQEKPIFLETTRTRTTTRCCLTKLGDWENHCDQSKNMSRPIKIYIFKSLEWRRTYSNSFWKKFLMRNHWKRILFLQRIIFQFENVTPKHIRLQRLEVLANKCLTCYWEAAQYLNSIALSIFTSR